jgi:hypothetical protein
MSKPGQITKLWVVRDPQPHSEATEVVFEATSEFLYNYARGGISRQWTDEHTELYDNEQDACREGVRRCLALQVKLLADLETRAAPRDFCPVCGEDRAHPSQHGGHHC